MFAVIKTGGKQYRVSEGSHIKIEKLMGEAGSAVTLEEVLMIGGDKTPKVGTPFVKGAKVEATIVEQTRAAKVIIFKKKRRQNYRRKKGHKQPLTLIKITKIIAA